MTTEPSLPERTIAGLHAYLRSTLPTPAKDLPVLDIGCGSGAWLQQLSAIGYTDLLGIDRDVSRFAASGAACRAIDLDRDDPDFGTTRFALMTAIEVIEHLENPGNLFRLISAHLATDGVCLLTTPNVVGLSARLRFLLSGEMPSFDAKGDLTHLFPILPVSFARILPRYSLRLARLSTFPPRGTRIFRYSITLATAVLRFALPDELSGDTLCLEIRRDH